MPTPAMALGAYEVTPLEIAGAYTIFDNHGVYSKPYFVSNIASDHGSILFDNKPEHRDVLDPRVAFLMDQLLEEVVRTGTGAGVWARGINFPIAGKTGTSHDGWFAGFTSKLICVVWVGFDDNRELNLEGAHSALPVWAEFMRRAHEHREYRNVSEFDAPPGVVGVQIDPASGQLATAACPKVRTEYLSMGRSQWSYANCTAEEEPAWLGGKRDSRRVHRTRRRRRALPELRHNNEPPRGPPLPDSIQTPPASQT